MNEVFLLLGSNLGDRFCFLRDAIVLIEKNIAPIVKASSIYETEAWGKTDEPNYLNQVVMIKTDLPAETILRKILEVERSLGRERKERWGSRTIDIDILFYGDQIITQENLTVPHPRLHLRRFTLEPLVEIDPDIFHPVLKQKVVELKNKLDDNLIVKKL